jgi:hypothetical protein
METKPVLREELEELKKELAELEKEKLKLWNTGIPKSLRKLLILYETVKNPFERRARSHGKIGKELLKGLPLKRIKELCHCSRPVAVRLNRALRIILIVEKEQRLKEKAIQIQLLEKRNGKGQEEMV